MARLTTTQRARLPDSAFAYVDSKGQRRLPIHDEPHVRNALARFERVAFEDDAARERARKRLLNAAKRFGIVPVGFIDGQLRSERKHAASGTAVVASIDPSTLPTGEVTFLLTDIERSTALLRKLGDRYAGLLDDVRDVVRSAVLTAGGKEVDARADEFFAAFTSAPAAVEAAVEMQRTLGQRSWPDDLECRVRAGIHSGHPTLTKTGYIGIDVHTAARVCAVAHGGQVVATGETKEALQASPVDVRLKSLGRRRLPGLPRAVALYQVEADGLESKFPRLRIPATRKR